MSKLNNSQMYFRDIPIEYRDLLPITSGHVLLQGNNVNCTKIMSWSASSVLTEKIEPAF